MKTIFLLMAMYEGRPVIPAEAVCRDFFARLRNKQIRTMAAPDAGEIRVAEGSGALATGSDRSRECRGMRREFSAKIKAQAFLNADGCCQECNVGVKLRTGDIFYDHIIPDAIGGEPTLENCQVLCRKHHDAKTRGTDVPRIAKAKRVRRKHIGIRQKSKFACSKDGPFKKKLDGTVVRRAHT